jgi:hypothetical protein
MEVLVVVFAFVVSFVYRLFLSVCVLVCVLLYHGVANLDYLNHHRGRTQKYVLIVMPSA